jgi:hypothetical protein
VDAFNTQPVNFGPLPPDILFLTEIERYLAADVSLTDLDD